MDEKQQIAKLIREDRKRRGMTIAEHAAYLGVHFTTYHYWLRAERITPVAVAVFRLLQPETAEIAA